MNRLGGDDTGMSDQPDIALRVKDLHKSFGPLKVLRGTTLAFPRGRTTVVLGPSGCGKSVMLKHLVALERPDRGEVWFGDQRIDHVRERDLGPIRRKIGFLFQQSALFDSLTVGDNVAFPLVEHGLTQAGADDPRVARVLASSLATAPALVRGVSSPPSSGRIGCADVSVRAGSRATTTLSSMPAATSTTSVRPTSHCDRSPASMQVGGSRTISTRACCSSRTRASSRRPRYKADNARATGSCSSGSRRALRMAPATTACSPLTKPTRPRAPHTTSPSAWPWSSYSVTCPMRASST
jgi:ABC-type sugar transport system ATPase subunit